MDHTRLVERFYRYIECSSESRSERKFCELIENELKRLGVTVSRDDVGEKCDSNGWNIYGYLPGKGAPILLSAHLDTVTPGVGIRPVLNDGVIHSSGDTILGADDKSAIAAILEAIEIIKEQKLPHRPIEILFSVCEEIGLLGSKHADYSRIKSKEALVLDTKTIGVIINNSPAYMHLYIEIFGKSAHAGVEPDKGIHALKAAAAAISQIPCGFVDKQTVMNVANMSAPGKSNIVPDKASFEMEVRCFDEQLLEEHIQKSEAAIRSACETVGATYKLRREKRADLLYVPEDSDLIKSLFSVYKKLGLVPRTDRTFGGSDATWLFYNGVNAVNVGTGMSDAHSLDEHITVDDLALTLSVILDILSA